MTILMPALMAALFILPAYFMSQDDTKIRTIAVYDGSTILLGQLESNDYTKYKFIPEDEYNKIKDDLKATDFYAMLVIQPNVLTTQTVQLISTSNIPFDLKNQIQNKIRSVIEKEKMAEVVKQTAIPDLEARIAATKTKISVNTIKLGESGEAKKSSTEIGMILGYIFGFVIYMFILLYGQMVMQGVMEEKQSRIVEVIISSVKPFELMMGKIIGIAMVGLTQLAIWIILGIAIIAGAKGMMPAAQHAGTAQEIMAQAQVANQAPAQLDKMQDILSMLGSVNFPLIIGCFIFFFIGGYLLYSSMFAAVGSAVDAMEDAQQFMMPIMMPIILAILVMMSAIKNPEGSTAFWFSIIPFTSPVVMMARIPFGVPAWQLALSMLVLVITFVGMVWAAGKIYRTGILMYGKKASWKELGKWLTYKS
ncbi:MAG: ABC transporter permease [Prolixibacteraceae bacterium]|jgi:ABC-2 type transport system permease protein|nr:ABC transporter permease [Prolixibacteraceae bacterium]